MGKTVAVTVAFGDGVGPEIMNACLKVLYAAGAAVAVEPIDIGERVYRAGNSAGIGPEAWASLRRTRLFYKAPITTPQGGGYKSLNVTVRKTLGLFANVRPCRSLHPFVATRHPAMDLTVVRENEEDLYAGIEHRQTRDVYQCLKLVSRPGCERIVRYAFDYARANGRKKVSCFTKDNIMKLTDGLFHRVFDEIGAEYPEIEREHLIVDIGAARLADTPERFDVLVMPNLYGDILSDVAAQISGSVGLGGSANIGVQASMFEAIHGSAPDIAGRDIANPSGLLLAGVMMLVHAGQPEVAERVHNAWLRTIEEGIHTPDIHRDGSSRQQVGTAAFADAVIARLGSLPEALPPVGYGRARPIAPAAISPRADTAKRMVGLDLFLEWAEGGADELAQRLRPVEGNGMRLQMITNRGVKVWPDGAPETFTTDHWRCRFTGEAPDRLELRHGDLVALMQRAAESGLDFIKTETLCTFDGQPGYSLGQGQ